MPFTVTLLTTILLYTWVLEPRGVPVWIPIALVVSVTAWNGIRSGVWGLSLNAFASACRAAALFTMPAVLIVLAIGMATRTLHNRGSFLSNLAVLIVWGGAQQWALHTVVLRELGQMTSRTRSILLSAFLFALLHVPNPFLTLMTFVGALGWCAIFSRYPNIVPLAVSHAVATLALLYAFDDRVTGGLRVGYEYLKFVR
jgi:membrane protease YdiL (CAAX protease family)